MRFPHSGYVTDRHGNVIPDVTINVYLAGTLTPATVYTTKEGTTPVNSVTADSLGRFIFYVDNTEYGMSQFFKIVCNSIYDPVTYDDIPIILSIFESDEVFITE